QAAATIRSTARARSAASCTASAPRSNRPARASSITSSASRRSCAQPASPATPMRPEASAGAAVSTSEVVVVAGQAREDVDAVGGHRDHMLPLRRELAVLGDHGPAVGQQAGVARALVDHRLDGEGHALLQHKALARAAVVQHLRFLVVDPADAMAAVLAHHAEAFGLGVGLDGMADVAQGGAGLHRADATEHRFAGHLHQAPGHHRRRAGEIHAAGVAVPAVLDDGDVDIDDVAILQDLGLVRDAMADDVVDGNAGGLGLAAVADVGRRALLHIDDVLVADAVELFGAHAGLHVRGDHLQDLGGQVAGDAHLLYLVWGLGSNHGRDYRRSRAPPPKTCP